jgi:hypothetical protein
MFVEIKYFTKQNKWSKSVTISNVSSIEEAKKKAIEKLENLQAKGYSQFIARIYDNYPTKVVESLKAVLYPKEISWNKE